MSLCSGEQHNRIHQIIGVEWLWQKCATGIFLLLGFNVHRVVCCHNPTGREFNSLRPRAQCGRRVVTSC